MGFIATLGASALVTFVQSNGNSLFGISVHAQQVLNIIAAIATIGIMLFLQFKIINKERK